MSDQRDGRRTRIVAFVAFAFLAGMTARGLLGTSTTHDEPAAAPSVQSADGNPASPGPTDYRGGIPIGFSHSEAGARAAAVSYVLTGQVLVDMPPTRVGGAIRTMAAAASADVQVADAEQRLRSLRDVLADGRGPVRYLQAVLATRVEAHTSERARVSVWSVGVLSRSGVAAPQAGWTISVFELVWERGDWKIWSETISAGPAPMLNAGATPASSEELEDSLHGFTPWTSEP